MASNPLWDEKSFCDKLEDDAAVLEELTKVPQSEELTSIISVLRASVQERIELIAMLYV